MMKYFSIFVLSALSAYSVQAADTAQQLRKRDRHWREFIFPPYGTGSR